jgi:hypothetical protein
LLHVLAGKVLVHVIITVRIPAIAACFKFGPAIAACFEFGPAAAYMYWFNLNKNSQFARSFRPEKRSSGTIILSFFKNSVTAGRAGPADTSTANMRMVPLNNLDVANGPFIQIKIYIFFSRPRRAFFKIVLSFMGSIGESS